MRTGRPPIDNPMRHTAVAMPAATIDALREYSKQTGANGVSAVIRAITEEKLGMVHATPNEEGMVQTALWLPRPLHAALKEAGGERGLGEEIRRRLAEWQTLYDQGYRVRAVPQVYKVEP